MHVSAPPQHIVALGGPRHEGLVIDGWVDRLDVVSRNIRITWAVPRVDGSDIILHVDEDTRAKDPTHASDLNALETSEIRTEHKIDRLWAPWHDDKFMFPFDEYHLTTQIRATARESNVSIPIEGVQIQSATMALNPSVALDGDTTIGDSTASRKVSIRLRRSMLVQSTVVALFSGSWILTLAAAWMTILAARNSRGCVPERVFVLPAVTILTVEVLRTLWMDAPMRGMLDYFGLYPQVILMTSLLIIICVNLLRKRAPRSISDPPHPTVEK